MTPYLQTILAFAGIWAITIMSPGPDFVVTIRYATAGSRRHGVMAALGVAAGCTVWAVGSLLGLSVLLSEVRWLYDLVRLVGALYLVYLGVRTILGAKRPLVVQPDGTARLSGLCLSRPTMVSGLRRSEAPIAIRTAPTGEHQSSRKRSSPRKALPPTLVPPETRA